MNARDDQALHELMQAWEGLPPDEAGTQQLIKRLQSQMKQTAQRRPRTAAPGLSPERKQRSDKSRPYWWRRRWVWAPIILILALEGVFAWNRRLPVYQIPQHVLPADNGFLDFIAAGDRIQAIDPELRERSPYLPTETTLTWSEAQSLAGQVQPALERIRSGLHQPHIVPPHETYTVSTRVPYLAPLRELARQGVGYADVQLVQGDRAGALDTYLLLLELGEQVKQGFLIAHLVGIAIQYIAGEGLINSPLAADGGLRRGEPSAYDLHRHAWQREADRPIFATEPDWSAAGKRLQRIRRHWMPLRQALEIEREAGLNITYQLLSHPRPEKFFSQTVGEQGSAIWGFGRLLQAGLINRRKFFQEVETAYDDLIAALDQAQGADLDQDPSPANNPLVKILVPVCGPAWGKMVSAPGAVSPAGDALSSRRERGRLSATGPLCARAPAPDATGNVLQRGPGPPG